MQALVHEWRVSGTSLTYGGWLERELLKVRRDTARLDWLVGKGSTNIRQASDDAMAADQQEAKA